MLHERNNGHLFEHTQNSLPYADIISDDTNEHIAIIIIINITCV